MKKPKRVTKRPRPASARAVVRAAYPKAVAVKVERSSGGSAVIVYDAQDTQMRLGLGLTEGAAWENAAVLYCATKWREAQT